MNANAKRQGMAIASLVLGVLSVMCLGLFAGIPAIFLGHAAHRRARREPEQYAGTGLAIAGFVMGYASVLTTFILAGLLLPALAKAKYRAQSIYCINNLKNVGLAFRIYATDHQDLFPFHTSTNNTQTATGATAPPVPAETDPAHFLRRLTAELGNPKLLVCPADSSKRPAADLANLTEENISYEFEAGPDITASNPGAVLATCPIHGHELLCDGSVQGGRRR